MLLGQITNTNARDISRSCASAGIDVYFHTVVGDNIERMVATFRQALDRADVVIVTGGLGPTPDDITREAVAEILGVELRRDPVLEKKIRAIFERMGR
ncbi:MAG: nicotinamide-nucleotide amidase, partial [Actinomycetota bacterium]|nr:nicotinamide-nucleotide amidase [Actinomycetota bacterium]